MHPSYSPFLPAVSLLLGVAVCPQDMVAVSEDDKPPPRIIPLEEKKWEELSDQNVSRDGNLALSIRNSRWRHAESEHYVLHYRRVTEAKKVIRELEFNLWFVAKTLQMPKERYRKKGHAFIFEDGDEWKDFLLRSGAPTWSASYAKGDELFLNVRHASGSRRFDSSTLAHEATHAVVARIYPRRRWPLWLNEGFAEYMEAAGVAARKGQSLKRHHRKMRNADLSLDQMFNMHSYPPSQGLVTQLYSSAYKLVRYLLDELPAERFPRFVEAILDGQTFESALASIYGDKVASYDKFLKAYEKFD